ncbi:MAG: hypothetical protein ASARMPRED_001595 [Alectoria sarmentosa]|nr:MAG: hypothetical protein ASARMPRED_001595 [Alectoria sarmentosa]
MDMPVTDQQDGFSDYGSDFTPDEEEILNALLHPKQDDGPNTDPDLLLKNIEDEQGPRGARVPHRQGQQFPEHSPLPVSKTRITIRLDGDNNRSANIESRGARLERESSYSIEAPLSPKTKEVSDLRSPLERFRTKPKKALSVTDLISPSWCELQYWFTLTKHGKKRSTPAMKQGSAVHKVLEDQVHRTVAVDTESKEEAWGLRIWNVIQGLKGLRDTGMTRELEIWGVVDGLVVNGVIDELSYTCPEPELEEAEENRNIAKKIPAADQRTITDFLGPSSLESNGTGVLNKLHSSLPGKISKLYITDVKTRATKSIPKAPSFRPTMMQLMLYHLILSDLATNKVNADVIFDRYELKAGVSFSDGFITQIGSLNEDYFLALENPLPTQEDSTLPSSQDSMNVLLAHNSLRELWTLMMEEFARTFSAGAKSIGNVLKAEYRTPTDGAILGNKTFLYDDKVMQEYLDNEMRWWKGERAAEGVCVEEAYKCRTCDFFDECSWRRNKIEEATLKSRERKSSVV